MARRPRIKINAYKILKQDRESLSVKQFGDQISEGDEIPWSYDPSKTTWPGNGWDHRRTTMAGYDKGRQVLRIKFFTDGAEYDYYDVSPSEAKAFRRANSPGRFINAVLNAHHYERIN